MQKRHRLLTALNEASLHPRRHPVGVVSASPVCCNILSVDSVSQFLHPHSLGMARGVLLERRNVLVAKELTKLCVGTKLSLAFEQDGVHIFSDGSLYANYTIICIQFSFDEQFFECFGMSILFTHTDTYTLMNKAINAYCFLENRKGIIKE